MNEPYCLVYQHRTVAIKEEWVAKLDERVAKLEGWVAKLVARLLVTTNSLGLNPDIPQKSKMGRAALAKKLLTHSSPPKKKYTKTCTYRFINTAVIKDNKKH
jgi:hypothetical protein